mmetsp:Transcript_46056/g.144461  ORF Transcript_46056/g.144461 Transcript_46056/m.144461 type:complete len:111 (-) Transcript_46056:443-775(-)
MEGIPTWAEFFIAGMVMAAEAEPNDRGLLADGGSESAGRLHVAGAVAQSSWLRGADGGGRRSSLLFTTSSRGFRPQHLLGQTRLRAAAQHLSLPLSSRHLLRATPARAPP